MGDQFCSLLLFFFKEKDKGSAQMLKDRFLDLDFCLGEYLLWGVLEGFLADFLCLVPEDYLLLPVLGKRKKESRNRKLEIWPIMKNLTGSVNIELKCRVNSWASSAAAAFRIGRPCKILWMIITIIFSLFDRCIFRCQINLV